MNASAEILPEAAPFRERRVVAMVALLALALRAYLQILAPTIAADAAYYLMSARHMLHGEIRQGLELYGLHPLYPFLTALLGRVTGSLDTAALLISIVASAAAVWPLYALFRATWGARVSAASCLVYALHPILAAETSEALPMGLFLFFFISALACGLRALRGGPWPLFPLAGACAALAYLTRTEGLMAGFLLAGAAGVAALRGPRSRVLLGGAAALAVGAALSTPYIAELSRKAGRFTITGKGGGTVLLQAITGQSTDVAGPDMHYGFWPIVPKKLAFAFTLPLLPFLLAGFWLERRDVRRHLGEIFRASLALAPPIALTLLDARYRPSHRYFLAGVVLFLPWIGAAMIALVDGARRRWPATRGPVLAVTALLAALLLFRSVLPNRPEERVYRDAGAWLAARRPPPGTRWILVSSSDKMSWYAGAEHVPFSVRPQAAVAETLRLCRASGASLLAIDSRALDEAGGSDLLAGLEAARFTRMESFTRSGGRRDLTVWIWRTPP